MGLISGSPRTPERESHIPMDVKFEEEPYEDEDWFLMLLSELIFDKLKLEKPQIDISHIVTVSPLSA